jgi:hypothetical protein
MKKGSTLSLENKRKISNSVERTGIYKAMRYLRQGRDIIDRRTAIGKALHQTFEDLLASCGPNPSPAEKIECASVRTKIAIQQLLSRTISEDRKHLEDRKWYLELFLRYSDSIGRSLERLERMKGLNTSTTITYDDYIKKLKSADETK